MDDLSALRLQIEWGVDEALEEAPVDRLRAVPPTPAPLPQGEGGETGFCSASSGGRGASGTRGRMRCRGGHA